MKIFYETSATAKGGREGVSALDDDSFKVNLDSPKKNADALNPEKLFAMGYAACFNGAMEVAAKNLGLTPESSATSVKVGIGQRADTGFALDIDVTARLTGLSQEDAQKLAEEAHQICPYSHATRGNIDVRLHVDIGDAA